LEKSEEIPEGVGRETETEGRKCVIEPVGLNLGRLRAKVGSVMLTMLTSYFRHRSSATMVIGGGGVKNGTKHDSSTLLTNGPFRATNTIKRDECAR
jgi:hypothetical protein